VSTARDLARFDAALDDGVLLLPETLAVAWRPANFTGTPLPTGLGWFVETYQGERLVWHFSHIPDAYSALILKMPSRRLTLIMLANSDGLTTGANLEQGDVTASPFVKIFLRLFARNCRPTPRHGRHRGCASVHRLPPPDHAPLLHVPARRALVVGAVAATAGPAGHPVSRIHLRRQRPFADLEQGATETASALGASVSLVGEGLLAGGRYRLRAGILRARRPGDRGAGSFVTSLTRSIILTLPLSVTRESLRPRAGGWRLRAEARDIIGVPIRSTMPTVVLGGGAVGFLSNTSACG
jgi:hypothetical protein